MLINTYSEPFSEQCCVCLGCMSFMCVCVLVVCLVCIYWHVNWSGSCIHVCVDLYIYGLIWGCAVLATTKKIRPEMFTL